MVFSNCESLKNITIPDSVIEISDSAFFACEHLNITVSPNVTTIGEDAFWNCKNVNYKGKAKGKPWGARNLNSKRQEDEISKEFYKDMGLIGLLLYAFSHKLFAKMAFVLSAFLLTGTIGLFICSIIAPFVNKSNPFMEVSFIISIILFIVFLISTTLTYGAVVTPHDDDED